jgi:FG-GAP-like repeat
MSEPARVSHGAIITAVVFIVSSLAISSCGNFAPSSEETSVSRSALIGAVSVVTQHNDNARTGANLSEASLTPSSVSTQFGYLYDLPVTGWTYGQPLVAANVTIGGAQVGSVLYMTTMHNMVYAFDATQPMRTAPLLSRALEVPTPAQDPVIGDCARSSETCPPNQIGSNIQGEIGILSTPVIVNQTMYLISNSGAGTSNHHYLHALDIRTLADLPGSPQVVTLPGGVAFQSYMQIQRSALLAANGMVYAAFASYCDSGTYHGWVIGFDGTTLKATAAWNATPQGNAGGIWQAGQGPAADANGNVYVQTGNGDTNLPTTGGLNASEAMVKLSSNLSLVDWFVPWNYAALNGSDDDFASGGVLLQPNTNLVLGGGKFGTIYVTQQSNLGHYSPTQSQPNIVQSLFVENDSNDGIHGSPVYWSGPAGPHIYVWASNDILKSFHFNGTNFDAAPQQSALSSSQNPGGMLSISASGNTNGIVWASRVPSGASAEFCTQPAGLAASDATNVTKLLWDGAFELSTPAIQFAKNAPATISNGKVFYSTFSNMVRVYGLGGFGAPAQWSGNTFSGTLSSSQLADATQLADVNGDGEADAVAFDGSGGIFVMLANGSGFGGVAQWSSTTFVGSHDAFSTQLADVNGDGKADAVAFNGSGGVSVMLSNGSSFGAPTQWSSATFFGTASSSVLANPTQLADVNGDGKADAIAFDGSGGIFVMLSTGSGFGAVTQWSTSNFIGSHDAFSTQLADVNGDYKADAVAFNGGGGVSVMLSTGSGFAAPTQWSTSTFFGTISASQLANSTQLADVNGDHKADAVAFDGSGGGFVMLSTGSGFGAPTLWSSSTFFGSHDAHSTQLADINGDGIAEAVAFNGGSTWVMPGVAPVGRGFGGPTQASGNTFFGTISSSQLADATQLADVNGDGEADEVAFDGSGGIFVMLANGSGFGGIAQWSSTTFFGSHDAFSTQLADVDGDGKADTVAFNGSGGVSVMLSTGSSFGAPTQWSNATFFGTAGSSVLANATQLADVNGDGKADAVAFDGSGGVFVMLSTGSSFGAVTQWSTSNFIGSHDAFSTQLVDVNGDHKADAVAFNGSGGVSVMLSTGSGFAAPTQWSAATFFGTISPSQLANSTQLADVNGDHKADAVAFDGSFGVYVMLSTGSGFGPVMQWSTSNFFGSHDAHSTQLADINGDGLADAVAVNVSNTSAMSGVR